ncbi:hypothetical protein NW837_10935 [Synechococcus sp. R6-10]|uniref:hypothetical protein n=2 Tax=Synechococcus TaxID=1129 RepID=UPI0039C38BF3
MTSAAEGGAENPGATWVMEKRILGNPADPLRSAAQLEPGMWVRLLYPPSVKGRLGIVLTRENRDRWLVTLAGEGEEVVLSLAARELVPLG